MSRISFRRSTVSIVALVLAAAAVVPMGTVEAASTTRWVNDDGALVAAPGSSCKKPAYATIQAAVTASAPGDTIRVCAGTYFGAVVDRAVNIRGDFGAVVNDGPASHPGVFRAAFLFNIGELPSRPGSGASISGFRIVGAIQSGYVDDGKLDFGVFSRGTDNVTIALNQMSDMLQAVTDWNGTGWRISLNDIVDPWANNGGGIGILVGGFNGVTNVTGNNVSFNAVRGTLHVNPTDSGGYSGTGITAYTDYRYGRIGVPSLTGNSFDHNYVALKSDTPSLVNVNGIELTDTRGNDLLAPVITGNAVKSNIVRGAPEDGIVVSTTSRGNTLARNSIRGATSLSCWDQTVGTGTAGTANTWTGNSGDAPSSPAGICPPSSGGGDDDAHARRHTGPQSHGRPSR